MPAGINPLAVIVSAIVSLCINFVWFTIVFRTAYIAGLGRTQAQMDAGPSIVAASLMQLVGFLVMATGLAWLMRRTALASPGGGLALALIVWTAFVAAIIGPIYAYQAFPLSLFGIVSGGYLIVLLVTGVILGFWR